MAYTKIKNIKSTVNKAIDYIVNFKKTNNGQYVYGYEVTPKTASIEFDFTEKMAQSIKGDYKRDEGNLAYHIVQSFDYNDIITPEEALEIGKKTVEEFTEGKFEYIIATHVDKTCIHNHIIFNSVSYVDYKRFVSKPYKTIGKLHAISDRICIENGLNTIKEQKNDSKSYYEWLMNKQGLSWKKTLKNIIDKNIINANSFDEFLKLMREDSYEIKQGKYLAFKHAGQERYIRAYKLGELYSEEKIKERITDRNKNKHYINTKDKKSLPLDIWLKIKARKQAITNIKDIANLILTLDKECNIKTFKDIKEEKGKISINYNEIKKEIKQKEDNIKKLQEEQRNVLIYLKYNNINEAYKRSISKKSYFNKYESKLILFQSAEKNIKERDIKELDKIKNKNEKEIKHLQEQYVDLNQILKSEKNKIDTIEKLESKLEKILEKETEQEQDKSRKKKRNISL